MKRLSYELKQAGASRAEIKQLLPIAAGLQHLSRSPSESSSLWLRALRPLSYGLVGPLLGGLLIISAEAAQPGSGLYPLQKATDAAIIKLDPSYRATVMMKQARQVNQLVAQKAAAPRVLAALADYSRTANSYRRQTSASYTAFEYCKDNLRQAAANASPPVRQAINSSIANL